MATPRRRAGPSLGGTLARRGGCARASRQGGHRCRYRSSHHRLRRRHRPPSDGPPRRPPRPPTCLAGGDTRHGLPLLPPLLLPERRAWPPRAAGRGRCRGRLRRTRDGGSRGSARRGGGAGCRRRATSRRLDKVGCRTKDGPRPGCGATRNEQEATTPRRGGAERRRAAAMRIGEHRRRTERETPPALITQVVRTGVQ